MSLDIRTIISEHIDKILDYKKRLDELNNIDKDEVQSYINENYKGSLNEMARINTKEFFGYFPCNKFDIRIWSNDHNPPHFHVIGDGWDIVVSIDNGEILKVKQVGKGSKFYRYVEDTIIDWLEADCAINKKLTNKENAEMQWIQNNPDT